MRIHFQDKQQAARFASAVVNVTGRPPVVARTETPSWRVHSPELNRELAGAICALLDNGTPCHQVTLDRVTAQLDAERRKLQWLNADRETGRATAARPIAPIEFAAIRSRLREELAIAAR